MQKINWTPFLLAAVIGFVAYDRFFPKTVPEAPTAQTHDAVVVQLGKDYRIKLLAAGTARFDAVVGGTFDNLDELTKAEREALTHALEVAQTPIAAELEKRFGKAEDDKNKPSITQIKSFYTDLEYGFKK